MIGAHLPLHKLLPGARARRRGALAPTGGARRGRGDPDHRHPHARRRSSRGDGFTVGGMSKGSGMIHPDLATMLAVVTTDYPLAAGRGERASCAPAVERVVQRDLGRRRALDQRLRDPARQRRERRRAQRRERRRVRRRARPRSAPTSPARSSPTARAITVLAEINVSGARRRRPGARDRTADRHLAARQDRALRPRRQLGPRADGGRQRALERRLRRRRRRTRPAAATTARVVLRPRRARSSVEPDVSGPSCTIELELGLGDGRAGYLTTDLSYDYVRINADYRT